MKQRDTVHSQRAVYGIFMPYAFYSKSFSKSEKLSSQISARGEITAVPMAVAVMPPCFGSLYSGPGILYNSTVGRCKLKIFRRF